MTDSSLRTPRFVTPAGARCAARRRGAVRTRRLAARSTRGRRLPIHGSSSATLGTALLSTPRNRRIERCRRRRSAPAEEQGAPGGARRSTRGRSMKSSAQAHGRLHAHRAHDRGRDHRHPGGHRHSELPALPAARQGERGQDQPRRDPHGRGGLLRGVRDLRHGGASPGRAARRREVPGIAELAPAVELRHDRLGARGRRLLPYEVGAAAAGAGLPALREFTAGGQSDIDDDGTVQTWALREAVAGTRANAGASPGTVAAGHGRRGTPRLVAGADLLATVGPCDAISGQSVF